MKNIILSTLCLLLLCFINACRVNIEDQYLNSLLESEKVYIYGPPKQARDALLQMCELTLQLKDNHSNLVDPDNILWVMNLRLYDIAKHLNDKELMRNSVLDFEKYYQLSNMKTYDSDTEEFMQSILLEMDTEITPIWRHKE